ncbi:MAG: divergent polysaccharide deacetylase family protein [Sphingobacteriia bacterium]|nr:divergent polysaccharide deacetylase family protein [Sphingobacteriia bacterium]
MSSFSNKLKVIFNIRRILSFFSWLSIIISIVYVLYFYIFLQNVRNETSVKEGQKVIYDLKNLKFLAFNRPGEKEKTTAEEIKIETPSINKVEGEASNNIPNKHPATETSANAAASQQQAAVNKFKPKIGFLVINLGLSESATKMAFSLQPYVGIGISPYSANIPYWENEFVSENHEIYVELPLEPIDYKNEDKGFLSILSYNTNKQNFDNLNNIIKKFNKLNGFYTFGNEKFSSSDKALAVYKTIAEKGYKLIYSDSLTLDATKNLKGSKVRYLTNPIVIDYELTNEAIETRMKILYDTALSTGYAFAIARPYPISIKIISNWIDSHKDDDKISIVNISELFK